LQSKATYRLWSARVLLLLFLTFWSAKTGHALLMHHQHADHPVCAAASDNSTAHLHDERYAPEDCTLCAFVPAVQEVFVVPVWTTEFIPAPDTQQPLMYESEAGRLADTAAVSRGPPTA